VILARSGWESRRFSRRQYYLGYGGPLFIEAGGTVRRFLRNT
jgi:hypothetical protein